jgi:MFS family permease
VEQKRRLARAQDTLRALKNRNYRIYFFGMLVSYTGTWMQSVAQSWLVYRLTGSPWLLGLVGFTSQIPIFLLTPIAGVIADRHNRLRLVTLTQILAMLQAFALAALTLTHTVTVAWVFALALVLGLVNALDFPSRQSFMADLVSRDDLMNAISLNSSMVQASRIVGPALAGILVSWLGEGACFLINGISFIAVIQGLFTLRLTEGNRPQLSESAIRDLKEGFEYVINTRPVRATLLLVAAISVFGLSYSVLLPVFASEVLGGGPRALGLLTASAGIGALGGALSLAARRHSGGLGRLVARSVVIFGLLIIAFAFSRNLFLSMLILAPAGFTVLTQMSASNTLVQTMVPDRLRGRMMSFYSLSLMGMTPFGSLLAGGAASHFGAQLTVGLGGTMCVLAAVLLRSQLPHLSPDTIQPDSDGAEPETVRIVP